MTIRHNKAPINHAMYQPKKGITLNIPTMNAIRISLIISLPGLHIVNILSAIKHISAITRASRILPLTKPLNTLSVYLISSITLSACSFLNIL